MISLFISTKIKAFQYNNIPQVLHQHQLQQYLKKKTTHVSIPLIKLHISILPKLKSILENQQDLWIHFNSKTFRQNCSSYVQGVEYGILETYFGQF